MRNAGNAGLASLVGGDTRVLREIYSLQQLFQDDFEADGQILNEGDRFNLIGETLFATVSNDRM